MNRPRFFTTSLAAAAVAATITFAAPPATAADADQQCGLPGIPAVYETVQHPAVTKVVPEQSHTEWLWELLVDTYEFEFSKLISPATTQVHWTRQVLGATLLEYQLKVIDTPYQPAVPPIPAVYEDRVIEVPTVTVTQYLYELRKPNKNGEGYQVLNEKWEVAGWGGTNGNNPESEWVRTDETREVVTETETRTESVLVTPEVPGTPEVPEESHLEYQWSATHPGGDWTPTGESRASEGETERITTAGERPAGDGWAEVSRDTIPAEYDEVWAAAAPDGDYTPTGEQRVSGVAVLDRTEATSAEAPDEGWTKVAGSETKVVDSAERVEVVSPARTEKVLVQEAVPGTGPCDQVGGPAVDDKDQGGRNDVAAPAAAPTDQVAGPQAAPAVTTGVLPNTGNGVSLGLAAAGLGSLAAGAVLMMLSRRNRFSVN